MYGVLAADGGLVGLAAERGAQSLAPSDLLLLANFVAAHDSFRLVRMTCVLRGRSVPVMCMMPRWQSASTQVYMHECKGSLLGGAVLALLPKTRQVILATVSGCRNSIPDFVPWLARADGEHVAHLPAAVQPGRLPARLHPLPRPGARNPHPNPNHNPNPNFNANLNPNPKPNSNSNSNFKPNFNPRLPWQFHSVKLQLRVGQTVI